MDPSGVRVVTGGYDYDVRLWDFAGMDSSLQSFRTIRPCERYILMESQPSVGRDGHGSLVVGSFHSGEF